MALARLPVVLAALSLLVVVPSMANAQTVAGGEYTFNRSASAVGFTISASMLFKMKRNGSFNDFTGSLSFDPARPADTHMDLTVFTASVDMKNAEQDHLLKSSDFFDVDHFPTMHFVSATTTAKADGSFDMTGDMTIRGVTKRMTIPVRMRRNSAGCRCRRGVGVRSCNRTGTCRPSIFPVLRGSRCIARSPVSRRKDSPAPACCACTRGDWARCTGMRATRS